MPVFVILTLAIKVRTKPRVNCKIKVVERVESE